MDDSVGHDQRTNASSGLFMPLTGTENISRLEKKFEHYFDEDENEETYATDWKAGTSTEWLDSRSHRESAIGTDRKEKNKSPQRKRRLEERERSTLESNTKSCSSSKPREILLVAHGITDKSSAPSNQSRECAREVSLRDETASCRDQTLDAADTMNWSLSTMKTNGSKSKEELSMTQNNDVLTQVTSSITGFSLANTERPKFTAAPINAKVDLQLSSDDTQPVVIVPAAINQYLRDYQREGIRFLYKHYESRTGAILGDDMGLGKTIQVIGFLAALLEKKGNHLDTLHTIPKFIRQMSDDWPDSPPRRVCKPFLIIGPTAVMYNWLDELNIWGYFSASTFHGTDKETCLNKLKKGKLEIVVTTFETFRDNVARLNEVKWEAVVVDEVHKIKGLKAQVTQALRIINTPCRFGLTGTALQNNMAELWSLLDWAQPQVLGSREEFQTEYVDVIETGQRQNATKRELASARKQKNKFSKIRKEMLLRRTKGLIADQLPMKEDLVVFCRLTDMQVSVYKAILSHPDMDLVLQAEELCDCQSGKCRISCCYKFAADGSKARNLVFSYMHLMLKAANHTALLIPHKNTKEKQMKLAERVCEVAFREHPQFIKQARNAMFRTLSDPKYCGKMKILQGLLSVFYASHDKVLIFSYSTCLLDIIEQYVISQGHEYRRIDGKVGSQQRRNIVHEFNKDSNIFLCLLSTKAGGLGLNLTGANRVIVFDANWNPSHDLQAQDRVYRIGQTRDVKIYRLISAGTIEENIYLRQVYKQQLNEVVIGSGNARRYFKGRQGDQQNKGELFGIKNMFSLQTGDSCLTKDILQRNEELERGLARFDITHYVPPAKHTHSSQSTEAEDSDDDEEEEEEEMVNDASDKEEEEDDEFLKQLFDSDWSSMKKHAQKMTCLDSSSSNKQTCTLTRPTSSGSDSDQDEFCLLPKLHGNPCLTDRKPGTEDKANKPRADPNQMISDIKPSTQSRTRGAVAGISWLFSDSEDENGENPAEKNKMADADSDSKIAISDLEFNPKKSRSQFLSELKSRANKGKSEKGRHQLLTKVKSRGKKSLAGSTLKSERCQATSVQSVLESEDVLHTHINPKVIGSSRAEDHMTHCALQDVFERNANSQALAIQCDPYSQPEPEELETPNRRRTRAREDYNTERCITSGPFKILVGQTPAAMKRQQWSDLCKSRGVDQYILAETLLTAGVEEKLQVLKEFYTHKHPQLQEILGQLFTLTQAEKMSASGKVKRAVAASTLLPSTTVATDSAHTPEAFHSSLDDESGHFLAVPLPSAQRENISSGSSQHWTRLRKRTKPSVIKHFPSDHQTRDGQYLDVNMAGHSQSLTVGGRSGSAHDEDIDVLLQELGHRSDCRQKQRPNTEMSLGMREKATYVRNSRASDKCQSNSVQFGVLPSERQAAGSGQRTFTKILDDIFSSSEEISGEQSSPTKKMKDEKVSEGKDNCLRPECSPAQLRARERSLAYVKLPSLVGARLKNQEISTDKELDDSGLSDDLLRTSTLKDDRSERRWRNEKRIEGKNQKEGDNLTMDPDRNCKFDQQVGHPHIGSESLFS